MIAESKRTVGLLMFFFGILVLYGSATVSLCSRFGGNGFFISTIAMIIAIFGSYIFWTNLER